MSNKAKRLERKKRKIEAFLEIAKLNDTDSRLSKRIKPSTDEDSEHENEEPVKSKVEETAKPADKKEPERLTDKPILNGLEYEKLREELRERKKRLVQIPRLVLKSGPGHDASVDMMESYRTPLFMADLQHLLVYAMIGDRASFKPDRWCKLEKWNRISNMVCMVVDGCGVKDFLRTRDQLPKLDAIFSTKLEFLSPCSYGSTVAEDLAVVPLSTKKKNELVKEFKREKAILEKGNVFRVYRSLFPIRKPDSDQPEMDETCLKIRLMLSCTQMIEENYPIPIKGQMRERFANFVMTKEEYGEVSPESPLFGIDCEMCLTAPGKMELTRICVIDSNLKVVYHTLVKPANRITNYLTRYSGITEQMLEDVTTTLKDVQTAIQKLLPDDAILIGHSLNSDLNALEMMHPYIIDTSVIYNMTGCRTRKSKLSLLSSQYLGRTIQEGGKLGHNPIEDAEAAMELVLLKLKEGYEFGDVLVSAAAKQDEEPSSLATSVFKHVKDAEQEKRICVIGEELSEYEKYKMDSADLVTVETSKAVIGKACEAALSHHFTICHVKAEDESSDDRIRRVQKWTKKLWKHISLNGMFVVVWTGDLEQNAFVGMAINKPSVV